MVKQTQTRWKQISNQWYQKTFINTKGVPSYTYYYRNKHGKPATAFEIDSNTSRQLCAYTLIGHDLRDCLAFLDEYLKFENNSPESTILKKALIRSLVITYGKCFSKADVRKVKLGKDKLTQKNKGAHEEMMRLRNEFVAHAGSAADENCKYVFLLPSEKIFRKKKIVQPEAYTELRQIISTSFFSDDCKSLLEELHAEVLKKIYSLNDKMSREVDACFPDAFYKLARTAHIRGTITEQEWKKMKKK